MLIRRIGSILKMCAILRWFDGPRGSVRSLQNQKKRKRMKRRKNVTKKRTLRQTCQSARLPRTAQELASKPNRFQDAYSKTIDVLKRMRADRSLSVRKAAAELKIDPRKVIRIGSPGSGLRRRKNGRFSVRPDDTLLRTVVIETSEGRRNITVRGFKQASLAGEH